MVNGLCNGRTHVGSTLIPGRVGNRSISRNHQSFGYANKRTDQNDESKRELPALSFMSKAPLLMHRYSIWNINSLKSNLILLPRSLDRELLQTLSP